VGGLNPVFRLTERLALRSGNTSEWQQNFLDVVSQFGELGMVVVRKTESDYFHEKCNLYGALFDLATSDDGRVRVLLSYANYLEEL
jgi:hypothetical protein